MDQQRTHNAFQHILIRAIDQIAQLFSERFLLGPDHLHGFFLGCGFCSDPQIHHTGLGIRRQSRIGHTLHPLVQPVLQGRFPDSTQMQGPGDHDLRGQGPQIGADLIIEHGPHLGWRTR